MNKTVLKKVLFMIFAVSVIFSSCTKKDEVTDIAEKGIDEVATGEDMQNTETESNSMMSSSNDYGKKGVIYVHNAPLYEENSDGKMKWAANASLGDIAAYLGEKKEAQRTDGQKRIFFHIELNGKEYWIQDYCYEPGTVPAFVAAQDTVLYKSESLTAATDEIIPQFFIVGVYENSIGTPEMTGGNTKFVKIAAYCPELVTAWIVKDKFVKTENLEFGTGAVAAMTLAQVASESRNDTIRAELFQNALDLPSEYHDDIVALQELTEVIIKEEEFLKTVKAEKIEQKVTVLDESQLLSIPNNLYARILTQIKSGTVAAAYKKAVLKDDDGNEVEWFYIQNKQKKGWITSASLKTE
ncbi:hypothetical protein [Treponema pedis]|uniref:hypothetical protein n=1 Tax=Treponema pedis TaxID=409322 RepID=UPI0003F73991|nr:hypothetical protein [Treponema pedis]